MFLEKLVLVLRDGRKLIGVLRSWDQFGLHLIEWSSWFPFTETLFSVANLVLADTIERVFAQDVYADIPRGVFLIRGENVLLLGEIVRACCQLRPVVLSFCHSDWSIFQDLDKDDYIPEPYRKASAEEVHALTTQEAQGKKHSEDVRQSKLQELGFEVEHKGEVLL